MRVIDADGHVEENPTTFSDKYFDPAFRSQRPEVVGMEGLAYWMIEEQLYPRRVGRGCNNLGTPVSYQGKPTKHAARKVDSVESMELSDLSARIKIMDEENLSIQVLYPTLFLAYPLSCNPTYVTAMCNSYNRWLGDILSGHERLKWVGVVNLDDIPAAAKQVHECKRLEAVGIMILGTAGDKLLDDPSLLPFYEAVAGVKLPLSDHLCWACDAHNNLLILLSAYRPTALFLPALTGF